MISIGSGFKVESSNQCERSDQETMNKVSMKGGEATGEGTPKATGLGYSFGKRTEIGTHALAKYRACDRPDHSLSGRAVT